MFTKEELYEIEKHFDYQASNVVEQCARQIKALNDAGCTRVFINKIVNEYVHSHDVIMTISAKASAMRNNG